MDDLISRAAAIDAALDGADDWDGGYNPERERYIKEHMAKVLAVPAIPIEYIERYRDYYDESWDEGWHVINRLITSWQEERGEYATQ